MIEICYQAHIVSQTIIRYDNRELLQLIHSHLSWSGLHSSAAALAKEAALHGPMTTSASIFTTPRSSSLRSVSVSDFFSLKQGLTKCETRARFVNLLRPKSHLDPISTKKKEVAKERIRVNWYVTAHQIKVFLKKKTKRKKIFTFN